MKQKPNNISSGEEAYKLLSNLKYNDEFLYKNSLFDLVESEFAMDLGYTKATFIKHKKSTHDSIPQSFCVKNQSTGKVFFILCLKNAFGNFEVYDYIIKHWSEAI